MTQLARVAPAGVPVGFVLWLFGATAEAYLPTVAGLALIGVSLYVVFYPPRSDHHGAG